MKSHFPFLSFCHSEKVIVRITGNHSLWASHRPTRLRTDPHLPKTFYHCQHGPPAPAFAPQVTSKYPGVASPHYNPEKGHLPHNTICVAAVRPTGCCSQDI